MGFIPVTRVILLSFPTVVVLKRGWITEMWEIWKMWKMWRDFTDRFRFSNKTPIKSTQKSDQEKEAYN